MAILSTQLAKAVETILQEYSKGYKAHMASTSCGLKILGTETQMTISGEVIFDGPTILMETSVTTNADGKQTTENPKRITKSKKRSYRQEAQESGLSSGSTGIERSVTNTNEPAS